jgi:sulfhydrogenase subunit beta (sulfur reductase)
MTQPEADGPGGADGPAPRWLTRADLERLLDALRASGHRVLGPVVRDGALALDEVRTLADLPQGWRDEQAPGRYRLAHGQGEELFGVVHGPGGLKPHVFAPREPLLRIEMDAGAGPGRPFRAEPIAPDAPRLAILGVRACDLAGLAVQDRVLLRDRFPDPSYRARRERLFLIAVGCTRAVETCFCASMGTGPDPRRAGGFDVALSELDGGFLARAGSEAGEALLAGLALAEQEDLRDRERTAYEACGASQTRTLPPAAEVRDLLFARLDHPRWDDVAKRCLSCANCTMVCPTCFCHDVRDEPALDLTGSIRVREWGSCFDRDHAQVHGLNFRPGIRERYRQWLTHKLGSWLDQFGSSGCVGCGRCITWCPVGIDLTEEVAAIATEARS